MRTLSEIYQSNLLNIFPQELILTWHQQYRFTAEIPHIKQDVILPSIVQYLIVMWCQLKFRRPQSQLGLETIKSSLSLLASPISYFRSCSFMLFLKHLNHFLFSCSNLNFTTLQCNHCSICRAPTILAHSPSIDVTSSFS